MKDFLFEFTNSLGHPPGSISVFLGQNLLDFVHPEQESIKNGQNLDFPSKMVKSPG